MLPAKPVVSDFSDPLTTENLANMTKIAGSKMIVNTIACYGGGLMQGYEEAIAKDPTLQNHLDIFTQTQADMPNQTARIGNKSGSPLPISTNNYLYFMEAQYNNCNYGQAARIADQKTKRITFNDAQSYINGEKIVAVPSQKKQTQERQKIS